MNTDREQRYRAALGWYPRRWRAQHEEALLGILLDQADAEERTLMSTADRRDLARQGLARQGLARRLSPVLVVVLIVVGALAALQIASMLGFGQTLSTQLLLSPPPPHPVPVGTSWTPLFTIAFTAGTLYLICTAILVAAAAGAALLIRSMRRG